MSGAKSDAGDAHTLAELVRTDAHQLRVAGDSPLVEGIKVAARAHQNLIWDRQRQLLRLRATLREYFPGRAGSVRRLGRRRGARAALAPHP